MDCLSDSLRDCVSIEMDPMLLANEYKNCKDSKKYFVDFLTGSGDVNMFLKGMACVVSSIRLINLGQIRFWVYKHGVVRFFML